MSNQIDFDIDVLASSPAEINAIAERLKQPSPELVSSVTGQIVAAKRDSERAPESGNHLREETPRKSAAKPASQSTPINMDWLRHVVEFKAIPLRGCSDESSSPIRCFYNSAQRYADIVEKHLHEVSHEFPTAIFLLLWRSESMELGKVVIRAGEVVQEISEVSKTQFTQEWTALDIFSPFRPEHQEGREFGSLWNEWVDDVIAKAQSLKDSSDANGKCDAA